MKRAWPVLTVLLLGACGFSSTDLAQGRDLAAAVLPGKGGDTKGVGTVPGSGDRRRWGISTAALLRQADRVVAKTDRLLRRRSFRLEPVLAGEYKYGSPEWEELQLAARLARISPPIRYSRPGDRAEPARAIQASRRVVVPQLPGAGQGPADRSIRSTALPRRTPSGTR